VSGSASLTAQFGWSLASGTRVHPGHQGNLTPLRATARRTSLGSTPSTVKMLHVKTIVMCVPGG